MTNKGLKFDDTKPRFDLIPPRAELELAKVLLHGASKYGPRNWELVDNHVDRYIAACRRHLNAYMIGEKIDKESGLPHVAHAICSLMFILEKDL